ncbi:MAG TPA: hypothetical protein DCE41_19725 [Cytophagales bacterium]|nr:hypothetical protein [Cytophagales bacterium]HAA19280.1 hypothetical protein [Cytophagales bacterium]HAP61670.1 hypothetical protein [Cytophagales bacterium]
MEKIKQRAEEGHLPVLFFFLEEENKETNHELQRKNSYRSTPLNHSRMSPQMSYRATHETL